MCLVAVVVAAERAGLRVLVNRSRAWQVVVSERTDHSLFPLPLLFLISLLAYQRSPLYIRVGKTSNKHRVGVINGSGRG